MNLVNVKRRLLGCSESFALRGAFTLQFFLVKLRSVMLTICLSFWKYFVPHFVVAPAILLAMANVEKTGFLVKRDRHCLCEVNTILYLLLKCVVRMSFSVGFFWATMSKHCIFHDSCENCLESYGKASPSSSKSRSSHFCFEWIQL